MKSGAAPERTGAAPLVTSLSVGSDHPYVDPGGAGAVATVGAFAERLPVIG